MKNDNDVLLKVDHLCQYFKMGNKELKAVDDVSFVAARRPRGVRLYVFTI